MAMSSTIGYPSRLGAPIASGLLPTRLAAPPTAGSSGHALVVAMPTQPCSAASIG